MSFTAAMMLSLRNDLPDERECRPPRRWPHASALAESLSIRAGTTRGTARQDCSATSKLMADVPCMSRLRKKSRFNSAPCELETARVPARPRLVSRARPRPQAAAGSENALGAACQLNQFYSSLSDVTPLLKGRRQARARLGAAQDRGKKCEARPLRRVRDAAGKLHMAALRLIGLRHQRPSPSRHELQDGFGAAAEPGRRHVRARPGPP